MRAFDFAELHMRNRGHWNGLSSGRLGRSTTWQLSHTKEETCEDQQKLKHTPVARFYRVFGPLTNLGHFGKCTKDAIKTGPYPGAQNHFADLADRE